MSLSYCLLVLLFVGANGNVKQSIHKIIGGRDALPGELPYQVSLSRSPSAFHFCGGAIYDELHVITAAHCVARPETIVVLAGSILRGNNSETVARNVVKAEKHENYNDLTLINDVAILKLDEPLVFGNTISPINLQLGDVEDGTLCRVSGWGITNTTSGASPTLQVVEVPIIALNSCISAYELLNPVLDTNICAGYTTGGKDACQGDSGGPLVCNDTLTGIVSWGLDCAHPLYPGVYARISGFLDWIERTVVKMMINETTTTDLSSIVSPEPANVTVEADLSVTLNETNTNSSSFNSTDFDIINTNNTAAIVVKPIMFISLNLIICYTIA